jgi:hypothetical protein
MYAQSRKIGKTNNFKILGSKKMEGLKQDSQNQLRSQDRLYEGQKKKEKRNITEKTIGT